MAQTRRNQKQEKPISIWIGLVGVAAAIAAAVYRFPAWPVSWMFWLVAAWMHRPPQLTGRKDSSGRQTVAHHGEQKLMNRHTSWRAMRWSLLPGRSLNPGWPLRLPFVWGVILAVLSAVMLPVPQMSWRLANAAGALLTVTGLAAARRAGAAEDDVCPGVSVADLDGVRGHREWVVGGLIAGLAVAIVAFTAPLPFEVPVHMALIAGALTSLAVLTAAATKFGLADWWHLVNRRRELAPGWQALKIDPAPRLIATREVGPATVDTFDAPPGLGAIGVFNLGPKLSTVMPSGSTIAILDVPSENTNGDPIVGSHHPRKFEVVSWPQGDIPNVMDPAIDQQVAELLFRCAPVWSWVAVGFARPAFVEAQRLTTDDSPAALWRVVYDFPLGPGWGSVKIEADKLGGALQTEAWIDASSGMALVGANVNDFDVAFLEEAPFDVPKGKPLDQYVKETIDDAKWAQRWRDALKLGQQPPVYQPATLQERPFESASGSSGSVNIAGFLVNQGVDPMEYRGLEPKLATVLKAAPFVAVLGYPAPGSAQGSRHPQAFRVAWSHSAPPKSPDLLPPGDTLASTVLLGGMINRAFDSCRLARPEVMGRGLACLTSPSSQRHLWQVNLRLYDGLTVNDVRAKERNIQSSLQVPYLRIVATDDRSEIVMILGEHHSRVKLATPEQTGFKLERNDWDTWFALAGVVAGGGERPVLVAKEPVDTSDHLIRYTFEYPPGLAYAMVKARADNLKTTAQVAYLNPQQIPGDAARFEVIVGEKFPLPERCGFDFDAATAMGRRMFPFAWGVLGKPVGWSIDDDPHQLISGGTGSGKSVAIQAVLFGALSKGWIVALADPTKGGADFQFAEPYCVAFKDTIEDTATMLKQVYAEVIARKRTNAANGVGSYKDLPEEARPDPMLVVIDEFFSLVAPLKVPAKSDNPESEALRKNVTEMNFAKATILDIVGRIAREARSAGVHLCLAAQRPDGKLLEGEMKFNLSGRILMGTASTNDRRVALRSALDAPVVEPGSPKGRGICESSTGYPELIQGWFAEQQQFADALSKVREPISDDDRLRLLPPAPTLIDATIEVEETWVGDHDGSTDAIWDSPGGASAWSTSAVPEWDPKTAAVPADQPMTGGSDVLDFALEEVIEERLNDDDFEDDDDFVFDLTEPEPEAQPVPADIPSPPRDLATFPPPTTPSMMPQPASLPPPPPGTPAAQAFAPPTTQP